MKLPKGTSYACTQPEFVGKLPMRQDLITSKGIWCPDCGQLYFEWDPHPEDLCALRAVLEN